MTHLRLMYRMRAYNVVKVKIRSQVTPASLLLGFCVTVAHEYLYLDSSAALLKYLALYETNYESSIIQLLNLYNLIAVCMQTFNLMHRNVSSVSKIKTE